MPTFEEQQEARRVQMNTIFQEFVSELRERLPTFTFVVLGREVSVRRENDSGVSFKVALKFDYKLQPDKVNVRPPYGYGVRSVNYAYKGAATKIAEQFVPKFLEAINAHERKREMHRQSIARKKAALYAIATALNGVVALEEQYNGFDVELPTGSHVDISAPTDGSTFNISFRSVPASMVTQLIQHALTIKPDGA